MIKTKRGKLSLMAGIFFIFSVFAVSFSSVPATFSDAAETNDRTLLFDKNAVTWQTSMFGESVKTDSTNGIESGSVATDNLKLKSISGAGKFTTGGYDGITFVNTKIDALAHDFYLEATVEVNEIGRLTGGEYVIGGQEGFALQVRDYVPAPGESDIKTGQYSNSFSAIGTKITYKNAAGGNVDIKNGIGARFVEGIVDNNTPPTSITQGGKFQTYYEAFDKEEMVYNNSVYKFSIEKINNSYTATYYKNETVEVSFTMYPTRDDEDKLLGIDKQYLYVGFAVARDCIATFSDITLDVYERSTEKVIIPIKEVRSSQIINKLTKVTSPDYNFNYVSNQKGTLKILINETEVADGIAITPNTYYNRALTLPAKVNEIEARLTPDADWVPEEGSVMSNYGVISSKLTVEVNKYGVAGETIVVTPQGSDNGDGTLENPLSIQKAINFVQPDQIILLKEGTYNLSNGIMIERGNDGSAGHVKRLVADPDAASRPILNFSRSAGFVLMGNYWHLKGFDITNTAEKEKGLTVWGNNNVVESVDSYKNGNTGIQISGSSTEPNTMWPSNNLILNCTAYYNYDANFEDADGFAAKLTSGEGNVFRGCIAYENADDGFDFYAKAETGAIGVVLVENCVAHTNGKVSLPEVADKRGNGNGFKMGGGSMPGAHIIKHSIAFNNLSKGVDSNSGPDIKVYNTTSVNNASYNYALYTSAGSSDYVIDGAVSFRFDIQENDETKEQFKPAGKQSLYSSPYTSGIEQNIKSLKNYFWENGKSVNRNGTELKADAFVSLEYTGITRDADGSINMNGFLQLKTASIPGLGARLSKTPGEVFTIGKIVDAKTDDTASGDQTPKGCGSFIGLSEFGGFTLCIALAFVTLIALKKSGVFTK